MAKVVTANMLATGTVVFFGPEDTWVEAIGQATMFADADAAEAGLARAQLDVERALVVEPFVADAGPASDGRQAMTLRDRIRAYGPTIQFLPAGAQLNPGKVARG